MTIGDIKEQFRSRFRVDEYGLYLSDGRRLDEASPLGGHRLPAQTVLLLRRNDGPITPPRENVFVLPDTPSSSSSSSSSSLPAAVSSARQQPASKRVSVMRLQPQRSADADGETDPRARKAKILAYLTHFFKRRPEPEELVTAKILPERPQAALVAPRIDVVQRVCEWLLANAADAEGIFRMSGGAADTRDIVESLVTGDVRFDRRPPAEVNPHAVTTALKLYFRERTDTLIPYHAYKAYIDSARAQKSGDERGQLENCRALVASMPRENREILLYLLRFLRKITQRSAANKMTALNMGVVFGPTLMRPQMKGMDSLTETEAQIHLIHTLIDHADSLLGNPSSSSSSEGVRPPAPQQQQQPPAPQTISPPKHASEDAPIPPQPCPWFRDIPVERALQELKGGPAGAFVVVRSEAIRGCYEALYVATLGEPLSITIAPAQDGTGWCKAEDPFAFPTLRDLVQHYQDAGYFLSVCPAGGYSAPSPNAPAKKSPVLVTVASPATTTVAQHQQQPPPSPMLLPMPQEDSSRQTQTELDELVSVLASQESAATATAAKRKAAAEITRKLAASGGADKLGELGNRKLVAMLMGMGRTIATIS